MTAITDRYEAVIGLEVHVELKTNSKIFCSCPTVFGAEPNTQCCPVCMGFPGALPSLNRRAVEYTVKAGLALNCRIYHHSRMDRKNYFYPDLPKAYQISQADRPLCKNGWVSISTEAGERRIGITRIHLEEDAGKLIHDGAVTGIDLNRCGIPLIEIVSEPELYSAEEAAEYVKKLRTVIMYTGISDCRMNEGSLRCDVNVSIRPKGETALGVRAEIKNLNSFAFMKKAIEYEIRRQATLLDEGKPVKRETRRFDPADGRTYPLREKETESDYRFLSEPDIPPILVTEEQISRWRAELPALPDSRKRAYLSSYSLPPQTADAILKHRAYADLFEECAKRTSYPVIAASIITTEVFRLSADGETPPPVKAEHIAELAELLGSGRISSAVSKTALRAAAENGSSPAEYVRENRLEQITDPATLRSLAEAAIAADPRSVSDYRSGKSNAIRALMGACMKRTEGRADPETLTALLTELLSQ